MMRTLQAAPVATAVSAAVLCGCATEVPVAEATRMSHPSAWVAVVPRTVRASQEFARLVEARKSEYQVEVVEYDAEAGDPAQRLELVRSALARVNVGAPNLAGYVMLVGGMETLPMGPWHFEGVSTPILSDVPVSAELPIDGNRISADAWRSALDKPPRWLVGRVPFDEPARAVRMLEVTLRQMSASTAERGDALLCADGIAQAWLLASARDALREMQWNATLAGDGGSCDQPAPQGMLPLWDQRAPYIAVLAAQPLSADKGGGLQGLLPGACARDADASTPPALMVAFASSFGQPNNQAMQSLIEQGWCAGGVAFTAPIDATPLTAAWRMSVLLPADLASGAPLGNSAEASRRRYWTQAGRDLGMILPGADEWRAQNTLSAVVLGDPALRAAGNRTVPPPAAAAPSVPVILDTPAPAPVEIPVVAATPAAPAESQGFWLRTLGLTALAIFLMAALLWVLLRKR